MGQFIVSARKYRPNSFETLVGQENIARTLKNSIARGQLAHAYLFCGPRGVGKTSAARIFAKTINCSNLSPELEPCGECESCRSFAEGRSYNIHELDAASNNSVDDIRTLTDKVRIPPQTGRYSVYIIDEVHMLTQAAFNAFLKTLEEPPAYAIFILATTEKHKIIPTILSRCQTYDFSRISVEDIVGNLSYIAEKEGVAISEDAMHIIARKADGAMRDALTLFDQMVAFCGREITYAQVTHNLNVLDFEYYFRLTDYIKNGDYASSLILFDEILSKGFNPLHFISGLSNHFRDLIVCKEGASEPLLQTAPSLAQRYKKVAAECEIDFLFSALAASSGCEVQYRQSGNQRLLIEFTLLKLSRITGERPAAPAISAKPRKEAAATVAPAAASPAAVAPVASAESAAAEPSVGSAPATAVSAAPVVPAAAPEKETPSAEPAPAAASAEYSAPVAPVPEPAPVPAGITTETPTAEAPDAAAPEKETPSAEPAPAAAQQVEAPASEPGAIAAAQQVETPASEPGAIAAAQQVEAPASEPVPAAASQVETPASEPGTIAAAPQVEIQAPEKKAASEPGLGLFAGLEQTQPESASAASPPPPASETPASIPTPVAVDSAPEAPAPAIVETQPIAPAVAEPTAIAAPAAETPAPAATPATPLAAAAISADAADNATPVAATPASAAPEAPAPPAATPVPERRSSTPSLKDLMSRATSANAASGRELTEERALSAWAALAENQAARKSLSATIAQTPPLINCETGEITFVLSTETQKSWVEAKCRHELEQFLRNYLENNKIQLRVEVAAQSAKGEEAPRQLYLPSDKAEYLQRTSPEFRNLQAELELEIK